MLGRLRIVLAWILVGAGSAALAYPVLAYQASAGQGRRLTAEVERALDHPDHPDQPRRPILKVPSPRDGQALGVIRIPAIDLRAAVLEGVAEPTLLAGPGHLPWTSMPGTQGVSVIAAHRDLHFRYLAELRIGDRIELRVPSGTTTYRVEASEVVEPGRRWIAAPRGPAGPTQLRLLTCWPPTFVGPAPQRLVVSAVPVPTAPPRTVLSRRLLPEPTTRARNPLLVLPVGAASGTPPWIGAAGVGLAGVGAFGGARGTRRRRCFLLWVSGAAIANVAAFVSLAG